MITSEANDATYLHEWLPSQLELQERYIHPKALGRGKELPLDGCKACFRCVVEAS